MLKTFGAITPYFKFKPKIVSIDNLAFKFHYRWSFAILLVSTLLVTSRQYIGEHIKCIVGGGVPDRVVETFCFFTTTFTLVRHLNESAVAAGAIPHPGVGPFQYQEEPIKRHAYYQWVPFVLFGQALLFYFPHYLWKTLEGGRIKILVNGLKMVSISKYLEKDNLKINGMEFPCKHATEKRVHTIKLTFKNRLYINFFWGFKLIFCEFLNLFNVLVQIYLMNCFLGGQFYTLGLRVMKEEWKGTMDILDVVFPKVTKCHFHKFGASGSIQVHDVLCIMALNIINEKIYTFLWFWYLFLLVASILALLWRFLTVLLHKSSKFNASIFSFASPGRMNLHDVEVVTQRCNFSNWMFLYFLASNMDGYIFREVLAQLSKEFNDQKEQGEMIDKEQGENAANHLTENQEHKENEAMIVPIDTVDSGQEKEAMILQTDSVVFGQEKQE